MAATIRRFCGQRRCEARPRHAANAASHALFSYDFDNIAFETAEFDARLGSPGVHRVRPKAARNDRQTILPPDLWQRYEGASIWRNA